MSTDTDDRSDNRRSYEKVGRIYNEVAHHSIFDNDTAVLQSLLQTEGDVNYSISVGSRRVPNLLHAAARHPKLFDLLLDYGVDFTRKDDENRTVVRQALRHALDNSRKRRKLTLRYDFQRSIQSVLAAHEKFQNSSNPCDDNGISHFHAACIADDKSAVKFFLDNGVDVNEAVNANSPYHPSDTPLHLAVKYSCPDVVEVLLNHGANVHSRNADGLSPVHLMVERKTSKYQEASYLKFRRVLDVLIKFVIERGVDSTKDSDDFGFRQLHVACLLKVESLDERVLGQPIVNIDQPVDFDSPVCPGYTALHFAAFANVKMFKLLLDKGANVEAGNAAGQTALDLCLRNYSVDEIHSILQARSQWRDIVLSDNKTKLLDAVSAMENLSGFVWWICFGLNITASLSTVFVPRDSPLWPGYTLLHLAVIFAKKIDVDRNYSVREIDDTQLVAECLKRGADVTAADTEGSTALHLAFYMQKRQVVEYLLDHHEKTANPVDKDHLSHLHVACATGHLEAVKRLLSSRVDVDARVDSTFKWHVIVDLKDNEDRHFFICPGSTALHVSVASGSDKITKKLLKHGADVHAQDVNGFTPIHRLCDGTFTPSEEIVDLLLSVKNLKNSLTHCGFSHLHVACHFRHCEAIKNLLKRGADINESMTYRCDRRIEEYEDFRFPGYGEPRKPLSFLANYAGYSPLHFSCSKGGHKAMKLLVEKNADLLLKNDKGMSPLRHLLSNGDLCEEYCSMFIKTSIAQARLEEEFGITKLHLACHLADDKLVKTLINQGANVNAKVYSDSPIWQGRTPLHSIVRRAFEKQQDKNIVDRSIKIVGSLMKHGADLHLADSNDDTPLHMIKNFSDDRKKLVPVASLISTLFEHWHNFKANPTNNQGVSLFHISCMTMNVAVIEKFVNHGVDVNRAIGHFSRDYPGSTPLHLVIRFLNNHSVDRDGNTAVLVKLMDMLLTSGANVNAADAFGDTPLHVILEPGLKIPRGFFIERLISNGADTKASNVKGSSPVAICLQVDDKNWESVDVFLKHGCDINIYNSVTRRGYIHAWDIKNIIKRQKELDVNPAGRTVLHNMVCRKAILYENIGYIELITAHGCDIDHQDNEGKTALHLAVSFKNKNAVQELLKNGADINITDTYGKTAFAYCKEATQSDDSNSSSDSVEDSAPHSVTDFFAFHAYKLEFIEEWVSEQIGKSLEDLEDDAFEKAKLLFHGEMEKTKTINIVSTSLSVYEFLMNDDLNVVYMNMTDEERLQVDQFFKNIGQYRFREINGLIKFKYSKSIGRIKLLEPALSSFNILTKYQLPDICCRYIFKFLMNEDLKRLIAAAT